MKPDMLWSMESQIVGQDLSTEQQQKTERLLLLSCEATARRELPSAIQEKSYHQEPNQSINILILDIPASRTVRNKYLFSKPPRSCFLLKQPGQTETPFHLCISAHSKLIFRQTSKC